MELMISMKTISSGTNSIDGKTKLGYRDFLAHYEGTWAEWIDGDIIMVPPASKQHQDIYGFLGSLLRFYVDFRDLGLVLQAPFQMRLDKTRSGREPDILYVASSNIDRVKDTYLDGPADMVIEIVSKESATRDREEKFAEYETAGIREYWLIDPIDQEAEFYRLGDDDRYHLVLPDDEGVYHSETVEGFWLRVSWLWQEPLPPVWRVWQELSRIQGGSSSIRS
jgi:Uma2 family endonuclease